MSYKLAIFDLDGTLSDPKEGITGSVQYALKALGIDEPDADKLEPFMHLKKMVFPKERLKK